MSKFIIHKSELRCDFITGSPHFIKGNNMAEEVNVNHFHRIFEELKNLGRMETQTLYDVINKRIINTDSYRDAMFEMNKEYPKEVVTFKDAVCVDWNMAEKVNPGVVNKIVKELQIKKIAENEEIK